VPRVRRLLDFLLPGLSSRNRLADRNLAMWALFYSSTALGGLGEHRREHTWDNVSEFPLRFDETSPVPCKVKRDFDASGLGKHSGLISYLPVAFA